MPTNFKLFFIYSLNNTLRGTWCRIVEHFQKREAVFRSNLFLSYNYTINTRDNSTRPIVNIFESEFEFLFFQKYRENCLHATSKIPEVARKYSLFFFIIKETTRENQKNDLLNART